MKVTTVIAAAALAIAGAACSEPAEPQETADTAPEAELQTVSADSETGGTFNLALPSPTGANDSSGGVNLNLGTGADEDRLIVGSGGIVSGDFGDAPVVEFGVDAQEDPLVIETVEPEEEDDGIIRIEPN